MTKEIDISIPDKLAKAVYNGLAANPKSENFSAFNWFVAGATCEAEWSKDRMTMSAGATKQPVPLPVPVPVPAPDTEVERLTKHLVFVERWANHHGQKSHTTPQEALSCIQHHPAILKITRSYVDGKVPETFNPYAEIAKLEARIAEIIPLFAEARDALVAIPQLNAKLYNVSLTLAHRMDNVGCKDWRSDASNLHAQEGKNG